MVNRNWEVVPGVFGRQRRELDATIRERLVQNDEA
jgi:hypothetical protein